MAELRPKQKPLLLTIVIYQFWTVVKGITYMLETHIRTWKSIWKETWKKGKCKWRFQEKKLGKSSSGGHLVDIEREFRQVWLMRDSKGKWNVWVIHFPFGNCELAISLEQSIDCWRNCHSFNYESKENFSHFVCILCIIFFVSIDSGLRYFRCYLILIWLIS